MIGLAARMFSFQTLFQHTQSQVFIMKTTPSLDSPQTQLWSFLCCVQVNDDLSIPVATLIVCLIRYVSPGYMKDNSQNFEDSYHATVKAIIFKWIVRVDVLKFEDRPLVLGNCSCSSEEPLVLPWPTKAIT